MKFRTEIKLKDAPQKLSPERLVLLMGSCFSDNIGARMQRAGWPVEVNPCGVIYNPTSMARLFELSVAPYAERHKAVESTITERDGRFASWLMGSAGIADSREECIEKVESALLKLQDALKCASTVILTLGTSDVWLLASSGEVVGNCHKHPSREFRKERLSVGRTVELIEDIKSSVRAVNPDVNFILTVSPRRYLSEGFEDNSRLKAVLLLACGEICSNDNSTDYFPAFEILIDDLRDYRFYASDMLHPSADAIEYVWDKFLEKYVSPADIQKLKRMEKELKEKHHIPLFPSRQ